MTLVDTNVLLDLVTDDPDWAAWSIWQFDRAASKGKLIISMKSFTPSSPSG